MGKKNAKQLVAIVGAGLAGSEAAWQLAECGHAVQLFEMRPVRMTQAHKTGDCAELVCSNSFKSRAVENAHGLLKAEMALHKSMILKNGEIFAVPAGQALAIDREAFAEAVTLQLKAHPLISFCNEEVTDVAKLIDTHSHVIFATGPLTSDALANSLQEILGTEYLSFYDAIAPVVTAESVDMSIAFRASRYGKGDADYLNCPMHHKQYQHFIEAVQHAEKVKLHQFEGTRPFEGCLPIEVMVERGPETLRFGPMKPVGLDHPETGEHYHAVVQLRQENSVGTLYNLVGFQTKMTWTSQKEVLALIPGLENAEFVRLGSVHRNTFLNGPALLNPQLSLKTNPNVFFAGQITGVEGYMESTAMGILAARQIAAELENRVESPPSPDTMMGALLRYITEAEPSTFQPMNANFGLLNPPDRKMRKSERKMWYAERALKKAKEYAGQV
ncbi:MAG: methylenetetrahydrofolate--tRNA-(uracil(54)-C(5))-methyltransferase (FADH(2)-oxidizing) TrmFO [SAR324 cluster bacterium]|nr:methylenetetrahydrofolate--tRNA-(uracil(54)-C(5))-methyltransferase (FADH(2)-oxidizing) TrmFO [SAR324 cluster bacterium]